MNADIINHVSQIESKLRLDSVTIQSINEALDNNIDQAKELLNNLHFADIADLIDNATLEHKRKIIEIISVSITPEAIALIIKELDTSVMEQVIPMLGEACAQIFALMEIDDAIHVLEHLPEAKQNKIISLLPQEKRYAIREGLSYPENTAGRIMNCDLISIGADWTIAKTIDFLRSNSSVPFDFYEIYVVDDNLHPIGSILVSRVIKSPETEVISTLMNKDIHTVSPFTDQEEVGYLFRQYGLVSAPVIDRDGKLIGMITIDEIVDVIEEEAEEDIMRLAGVNEIDLHAAVLHTVKHRFPWLFINLLTACMTSFVIDMFHDTIHQMVTLAAIMPIVASMGGNAGTQTLAVIVRAIANRDLNMVNNSRIIFKQVFSNCLNGLFLAILGGAILLLWSHDFHLSLIFALAVIINFTMAGFLGAFIPLTLSRIGIDPATASGVFLTALTDIIGFVAFLGLARYFLI